MLGHAGGRRLLADLAAWFLQLRRVDQFAAAITLVAPGVLKATQRTHALHEPIGKEPGEHRQRGMMEGGQGRGRPWEGDS